MPPDPRALNFTPNTHHDTYSYITPQPQSCSGRNILITGASKGLGRAMCVSYARAGCAGLALLARSSLSDTVAAVKAAASNPELKIVEVKCDTVNESDVAAAKEKVGKELGGKLDVVVNNAGYLEDWKKIGVSEVGEWWRTWEVNVKGSYLVARAFVEMVVGTEGGLKTMVMVSSAGALAVMEGASAYQASKTAQIRLNDFLMVEYGKEGLIAFAIHPGGVATELAQKMPKNMHAILGDTPEMAADSLVWMTHERREWLANRYVSVAWDMKDLLGKKDEIVEKDLLKLKLTQ